jgi:uncharacterized cofD-like protein
MKKIVTVGGGTGSYTVLRGLKVFDDIEISAIVSMADDGGSTGVLRDELGVLPPGDVRQCLLALSYHDDIVRSLISYRFEEGSLKGHSFGNILLAALEKTAGSFAKGVEIASDILKIKGRVLPITEDAAVLMVTLRSGRVLLGENTINHGDLESLPGIKVSFEKPVFLSSHASEALLSADLIVLGPGNFYCSLLPNLVVEGFKEAIQKSSGKIVLPMNLTNKKGHTLFYSVRTYVQEVEALLGRPVDYILCNNESPTEEQEALYQMEEGDGVLVVNDMQEDVRMLAVPLLSHDIVKQEKGDSISYTRSFIRHDSKKLGEVIYSLL